MKHLGFVTCKDLSRYFPSKKNPLFTHDDQIAVDYLTEKGFLVSPIIWGTSIEKILEDNYDLIIIRSPWDYMSSAENRTAFMAWLKELSLAKVPVQNPIEIIRWNIDKHYLQDLSQVGVPTVPTKFIYPKEKICVLKKFEELGPIVLKPSISAAAHDTYLIQDAPTAAEFNEYFHKIRNTRCFLLQTFLPSVLDPGEWSLIFINHEYSHSILKKPQPGDWLVQDELGGSVHWKQANSNIVDIAKAAFRNIVPAYKKKNKYHSNYLSILYGRVDIIESRKGPLISEIELIEPELFFLDRRHKSPKPYLRSLDLFCQGITHLIANKPLLTTL